MRTFITKHQSTGLKITFKYDFKGVLRVLEFDGEWEPDRVHKIISKVPIELETILTDIQIQKKDSNWFCSEVQDISFETFYKKYPKKVGLKETTEKAWNKLTDVDKMEAIIYIEQLKNLKQDGTAFPYPATYLNKKYWK